MAEGIEVRHAKGCRALSGGRCRCTPSYRVRVWSNREQRRVRKSFTSLAEAKAWRAEALVALRQGTLRAPVPQTVRAAAEVWLAGARQGTVRDRSGRSYKPSTIRTYSRSLTDTSCRPSATTGFQSCVGERSRRSPTRCSAPACPRRRYAMPSTRCARSTAGRSSATRSRSTRPRIWTCPRRARSAIGLPHRPRRRRYSTRFRRQSELPGRRRVTPAFGGVSARPALHGRRPRPVRALGTPLVGPI